MNEISKNAINKTVDIDLCSPPRYVGKTNSGRIDYRYSDLPAIQHWIREEIVLYTGEVDIIITGKMPTWLSMAITKFMCDLWFAGEICSFAYETPTMIENGVEPYVIF